MKMFVVLKSLEENSPAFGEMLCKSLRVKPYETFTYTFRSFSVRKDGLLYEKIGRSWKPVKDVSVFRDVVDSRDTARYPQKGGRAKNHSGELVKSYRVAKPLTRRSKGGDIMWEIECTCCGSKKIARSYYITHDMIGKCNCQKKNGSNI